MDKIILNNGIEIPLIGLGTWNLREQECERVVQEALDVGYRMIDTAHMYDNEEAIGNVLAKTSIPRSELFITTKMHSPFNSYEGAQRAIDESLNNLQIDYIDLYLIHEAYSHSEKIYKALEEAYLLGKVKAIGISNFKIDEYQAFI